MSCGCPYLPGRPCPHQLAREREQSKDAKIEFLRDLVQDAWLIIDGLCPYYEVATNHAHMAGRDFLAVAEKFVDPKVLAERDALKAIQTALQLKKDSEG